MVRFSDAADSGPAPQKTVYSPVAPPPDLNPMAAFRDRACMGG